MKITHVNSKPPQKITRFTQCKLETLWHSRIHIKHRGELQRRRHIKKIRQPFCPHIKKKTGSNSVPYKDPKDHPGKSKVIPKVEQYNHEKPKIPTKINKTSNHQPSTIWQTKQPPNQHPPNKCINITPKFWSNKRAAARLLEDVNKASSEKCSSFGRPQGLVFADLRRSPPLLVSLRRPPTEPRLLRSWQY